MDKPPLSAVVAVQSDDPAALKRRVEALEALLVKFIVSNRSGSFYDIGRHKVTIEQIMPVFCEVMGCVDAVEFIERGDHVR